MSYAVLLSAAGEPLLIGPTVRRPRAGERVLTFEGAVPDLAVHTWDRRAETFVAAVSVAPAPATLPYAALLRRLTAEERIAIRAAARRAPAVEDALALFAAGDLVLDHPATRGAFDALVTAGLLTPARRDALLAPPSG